MAELPLAEYPYVLTCAHPPGVIPLRQTTAALTRPPGRRDTRPSRSAPLPRNRDYGAVQMILKWPAGGLLSAANEDEALPSKSRHP